MTPTPEALAKAKEIDDGWRSANGWPGMIWRDGPGAYASSDRWPKALADRICRIALALDAERRATWAAALDLMAAVEGEIAEETRHTPEQIVGAHMLGASIRARAEETP